MTIDIFAGSFCGQLHMASRLYCLYSCSSGAHTRENSSSKRPKASKSRDVGMKPSNFKLVGNTERQTNGLKATVRLHNLSLARNLLTHLDSGCLDVALNVFDNMDKRDTFIWNVLIRGLTDNGFFQEAFFFYQRMQMEGVKPDNYTFPFVIKACSVLLEVVEGQKIHCQIIKMGLDADVYICNALIVMYSRFVLIDLAENLFHNMEFKDLVSWNSMISGYCSAGDSWNSLKCFREMQAMGVIPDRFSMIGVLGAISLEGYFMNGKEVHCQVIKRRFESDSMIKTSLVDMYGKSGQVDYSERVFNFTSQRNVALWNAMIGTYALNGNPIESFSSFKRMKECDNLEPDVVTFISLISSCTRMNALLKGKSIHGFATRKGLFPHTVLETALVDMYGKCGVVNSAHHMFVQMKKKNLASWNVMIAAFVQNDHEKDALEHFQYLHNESHLDTNEITFANILPAYAEVALPKEGQQIHGIITKLGYVSITVISNALIYMYAKCGDIQSARKIFNCMLNKDVVTWNTIIMAHAIHGLGQVSLKLFDDMLKEKNLKPNGSTFVSLLSSCSISGMVDEGQKYFNLMKKEYDVDPTIEHYGCMIDLIGRTGDVEQAKQFIDEMPLPPTARIWGSLLTASRNHKNIEVADFAANKIFSLENDNTGCYMLLSNMYAEAERWEDVARIRSSMMNHGFQKTIARSTVESSCMTYQFTNYDCSQAESNKIYDALDIISRKIGEEDLYGRCHHASPAEIKKERENSPMWHSVRLAICFGLIKTSIGNPVIVRKNVRICVDCHTAAKKISYITNREIIVGDSKIYHRFRNGQCSCNDYW